MRANYNTSIALFGLTGKGVEKEAPADSWTSDRGENMQAPSWPWNSGQGFHSLTDDRGGMGVH